LIPKKQRHGERIIASMATAFNRLGEFDRSEIVLRTELKHDWSELLVCLYGKTPASDPCAQLKHAEAWTADHPLSTALMLTLGRLAMRSQLWGMARSYLEVAIHNNDSADAFLEMGWLLETLNEPEQSRDMYRRGLELITENRRDQSIPDQITRITTTAEEPLDSSVTQLVYSNESK
jgi:HemY protein